MDKSLRLESEKACSKYDSDDIISSSSIESDDIPVDVFGLDIDYAQDRRYFMWKENGSQIQ